MPTKKGQENGDHLAQHGDRQGVQHIKKVTGQHPVRSVNDQWHSGNDIIRQACSIFDGQKTCNAYEVYDEELVNSSKQHS